MRLKVFLGWQSSTIVFQIFIPFQRLLPSCFHWLSGPHKSTLTCCPAFLLHQSLSQRPAIHCDNTPSRNGLYIVVVLICASILEEIVFQRVLTPFFDQVCACMVFNFGEFTSFFLGPLCMQRILPLVFLGVVISVVLVQSRNLLVSMLLCS